MIVKNSLKPNARRKLLFVFTCVSQYPTFFYSLSLSISQFCLFVHVSVSVSPTFTLVSLSHTHILFFFFSLSLSLSLFLFFNFSLSLYLSRSSFSICSLSSLPLFIYLHYFTSAMKNNTKLASSKKGPKKLSWQNYPQHKLRNQTIGSTPQKHKTRCSGQ